MRVMVLVKADERQRGRQDCLPPKCSRKWAANNEELVKAGIMLAGEGTEADIERQAHRVRRCRSHGHRWPLRRDQGTRRGLLALAGQGHGRGGCLGETLPQPDAWPPARFEIRPIYEMEDFGEALTPEARRLHGY